MGRPVFGTLTFGAVPADGIVGCAGFCVLTSGAVMPEGWPPVPGGLLSVAVAGSESRARFMRRSFGPCVPSVDMELSLLSSPPPPPPLLGALPPLDSPPLDALPLLLDPPPLLEELPPPDALPLLLLDADELPASRSLRSSSSRHFCGWVLQFAASPVRLSITQGSVSFESG